MRLSLHLPLSLRLFEGRFCSCRFRKCKLGRCFEFVGLEPYVNFLFLEFDGGFHLKVHIH
jgi:hypothetical protein